MNMLQSVQMLLSYKKVLFLSLVAFVILAPFVVFRKVNAQVVRDCQRPVIRLNGLAIGMGLSQCYPSCVIEGGDISDACRPLSDYLVGINFNEILLDKGNCSYTDHDGNTYTADAIPPCNNSNAPCVRIGNSKLIELINRYLNLNPNGFVSNGSRRGPLQTGSRIRSR